MALPLWGIRTVGYALLAGLNAVLAAVARWGGWAAWLIQGVLDVFSIAADPELAGFLEVVDRLRGSPAGFIAMAAGYAMEAAGSSLVQSYQDQMNEPIGVWCAATVSVIDIPPTAILTTE